MRVDRAEAEDEEKRDPGKNEGKQLPAKSLLCSPMHSVRGRAEKREGDGQG